MDENDRSDDAPQAASEACTICLTPRRYFADLPDRPAVKCPKCGSTERHRAFAAAFRQHFGEGSMGGSKALALRPDRADRAVLNGFGAGKLITFDGFPRDRPDVVGDPTEMDFPDDSFDVVLSNGFLASVRDPAAVVAEIRRVLKPGGAALFYESTAPDRFTVEFEDRERQASWYGEEVLDSYGIGRFRDWGFKDLEMLLGQTFGVGIFDTRDEATGRRYVWIFGLQAPNAEAPFMTAEERAAFLGEDAA